MPGRCHREKYSSEGRGLWGELMGDRDATHSAKELKENNVEKKFGRPNRNNFLKGQSHKKVGELRVWRGSLGPN
jgi:hypothetical protein